MRVNPYSTPQGCHRRALGNLIPAAGAVGVGALNYNAEQPSAIAELSAAAVAAAYGANVVTDLVDGNLGLATENFIGFACVAATLIPGPNGGAHVFQLLGAIPGLLACFQKSVGALTD